MLLLQNNYYILGILIGITYVVRTTKFSGKLTFLTIYYVRVRIRGYEMLVFQKIWGIWLLALNALKQLT